MLIRFLNVRVAIISIHHGRCICLDLMCQGKIVTQTIDVVFVGTRSSRWSLLPQQFKGFISFPYVTVLSLYIVTNEIGQGRKLSDRSDPCGLRCGIEKEFVFVFYRRIEEERKQLLSCLLSDIMFRLDIFVDPDVKLLPNPRLIHRSCLCTRLKRIRTTNRKFFFHPKTKPFWWIPCPEILQIPPIPKRKQRYLTVK